MVPSFHRGSVICTLCSGTGTWRHPKVPVRWNLPPPAPGPKGPRAAGCLQPKITGKWRKACRPGSSSSTWPPRASGRQPTPSRWNRARTDQRARRDSSRDRSPLPGCLGVTLARRPGCLVASRTSRSGAVTVGSTIADLHAIRLRDPPYRRWEGPVAGRPAASTGGGPDPAIALPGFIQVEVVVRTGQLGVADRAARHRGPARGGHRKRPPGVRARSGPNPPMLPRRRGRRR